MTKTCGVCGGTNPDDAVFCVACGGRLPTHTFTQGVSGSRIQDEASTNQRPAASDPQSQPTAQRGDRVAPIATYVVQLQPGRHKHIATDIGFYDAGGSQVMVARRSSLIGFGYEVVDGSGNLIGEIRRHALSVHGTFDALDAQKRLVGRVQHQLGSNIFSDRFWFEDASGRRVAEARGDGFDTRFVVTNIGGGLVLGVRLDLPGGFFRNLDALMSGRYFVEVYSDELGQLMLATFIAALELRRQENRQFMY